MATGGALHPALVGALRAACASTRVEQQPVLFVAAMQLVASACASDAGLADALLFPTDMEASAAVRCDARSLDALLLLFTMWSVPHDGFPVCVWPLKMGGSQEAEAGGGKSSKAPTRSALDGMVEVVAAAGTWGTNRAAAVSAALEAAIAIWQVRFMICHVCVSV